MSTNRKICSDIVEFLKANNVDERVSYRYILTELREATQTFIKQDADNRRLFKQTELFIPIPCALEMEESSFVECNIDIKDSRTMMKSVNKLPKSYYTNYGPLIKVTTVDGSREFKQTTMEEYKDMTNRRFAQNGLYFMVINDHLYIPNIYVEAVRVTGFWKDETYLTVGTCAKSTNCIKPLDMDFNCPSYLLKIVKDSVKDQLLKSFTKPVDEYPNLDSNQKTVNNAS